MILFRFFILYFAKIAAHKADTPLEAATTTATLSACRVGRDRGDILNSSDAHSGTGKSTQGALCTRSRSLWAGSTGGPNLHMQGRDAELLALCCHILRCQHGCIGRRLVSVGFHLHAAGDADNGFAAGEIGDMDKGVVEGGVDAGDAKYELAGTDLGTEGDVFLYLYLFSFLKHTDGR